MLLLLLSYSQSVLFFVHHFLHHRLCRQEYLGARHCGPYSQSLMQAKPEILVNLENGLRFMADQLTYQHMNNYSWIEKVTNGK